MHTNIRLFSYAALLALALPACSHSPATQALPASPLARGAAASPTLTLRSWTAGKSGLPRNSAPLDITLGADGAMWFTDAGIPAIGRITTAGKVHEYTTGLQYHARPYAITTAPDGTMWFSDVCGAVGSITTGGAINEVLLPKTSPLGPDGIAAGSDGSAWSLALGPPNALVHVRGTHYALVSLPKGFRPDGSLAIDGRNDLWMLGQIDDKGVLEERTAAGTYDTFATPLEPAAAICCPNYAPTRMTIGPHGDLWFTTLYWLSQKDLNHKVIGKTAIGDGKSRFYEVDSQPVHYPAYPSGIGRVGSDVWFSGDDPLQVNGALWRIDADGNQVVYEVPYNPVALAGDNDGDVWFTGEGFNNPGQIIEAVKPPTGN